MLGVLLVLQVAAIILAVIFDVQVTESIVSRITHGSDSEAESHRRWIRRDRGIGG